jgi:hypothetical protein
MRRKTTTTLNIRSSTRAHTSIGDTPLYPLAYLGDQEADSESESNIRSET